MMPMLWAPGLSQSQSLLSTAGEQLTEHLQSAAECSVSMVAELREGAFIFNKYLVIQFDMYFTISTGI